MLADDIAYITGSTKADLYAATQTARTMPPLRRTVFLKNRPERMPALAAVFSGFMTPADKEKITPSGYNSADMPDNFTDALAWRGKKYLNRRYLLSMFLRFTVLTVFFRIVTVLLNKVDAPETIHNPVDFILTLGALAVTVLSVFTHFAPYIVGFLYMMRILLLVTKRRLTDGAQMWLMAGLPFDPIRAWTRRTMLSVEDNYFTPSVIGQTARVVLTDRHDGLIRDHEVYEAFGAEVASAFYGDGYVSSEDRLRLALGTDPTIISGGVGVAPNGGAHLALYVLGIGHQSLTSVERALRDKYLTPAVRHIARQYPHVHDCRVYFEVDPHLYDCQINSADHRSERWERAYS